MQGHVGSLERNTGNTERNDTSLLKEMYNFDWKKSLLLSCGKNDYIGTQSEKKKVSSTLCWWQR